MNRNWGTNLYQWELEEVPHEHLEGGAFCSSLDYAPFELMESDGTEPVGALSSLNFFVPDRRNSRATYFLLLRSDKAICRWLNQDAKSCVISGVLSVESLFGIGEPSEAVTKYAMKKTSVSSLSNQTL